MEIFPPKKIKIVDVPGKGRGVVALEDIEKDEIIEICPILFISKKEVDFIKNNSEILKYYYLWQYAINKYCLMLGYGSIYNHSLTPNADVDYNIKNPKNYLQNSNKILFEDKDPVKATTDLMTRDMKRE